MQKLRALWMRLRGQFGGRGLDDEFSAELESHLQMHIEDNLRAGMPIEQARREALIKLGGMEQAKQAYRERTGLPLLQTLRQDIRFGLRILRKSPGFTLVALITLSLGIGANTAIFSFIDALFLKPIAVPHSTELVHIYAKGPSGHYGAGFSYPEFKQLRDHTSSFTALALETERPQLHLVSEGDSQEIRGEFVSSNYFTLLRIQLRMGRGFSSEEDTAPNRNAVAVISDQLWKSRFHDDPAVLGREIHINRIPFKVIGIAPAGFYGDLTGLPVEAWIPTMMYGAMGYGCDDGSYNCSLFDSMIGRLSTGQPAARAQSEASSDIIWSATNWPERPSRRQLILTPANGESPDDRTEDVAQMHLLMSVTALLLLIACANLSGLLLARGVTRRREIAVRLSIGAQRSRVVRQLITESLLLAIAGAVLGLVFSFAIRDFLMRFYTTDSEGFRHSYDFQLDWRVIVYSVALSLLTGILFGLVPAIRASKQDLIAELKEGGAAEQYKKSWLRQGLVVGQVTLSMILVISSGLLIRSSFEIRNGTNFNPTHIAIFRLRPELIKYTPQQVESLIRKMQTRFLAVPGVKSTAFMEGGEGLVWNWRNGRDVQISLPGQIQVTPHAGLSVLKQDVSPGFFQNLEIPLLQGREFDVRDRLEAPRVAILNEALAAHLWSVGSAVGRSILVNGQPVQVVGVCANIQPKNQLYAPEPHLYLSYWQSNAIREGDIRMAIRVAGTPASYLPLFRRLIQSIDQDVPIGEDMPMAEQINLEYMPVLLAGSVVSFCGLLALCLSAMGLYSILAFAIRTRTREIGIRMALGAKREDVLRMVVGQGTRMALAGVGIGIVMSLFATRIAASLLYGVKTFDPVTYCSVSALLSMAAFAACYLPALRVMRIDPMQALHTE